MIVPILALDIAQATGWAAQRSDGNRISGTKVFGPPDIRVGPLLAAFGDWLTGQVIEHAPGLIYYERPWVGLQTHQVTALKLMSLAGLTEMIGYQRRIIVRNVRNPVVVKHFTGSGGGKRIARKARVMAECRARGLDPKTEDEADALAILDYARHDLADPKASPGRLLDGREWNQYPVSRQAQAEALG